MCKRIVWDSFPQKVTNRLGERWEISLKGAGKTPYSRSGDGRYYGFLSPLVLWS